MTAEDKLKYDSYYAEGAIFSKVATSEGFAKAFLIMARMEGIPTVYIGEEQSAWNKVYVDGDWYVIDSTVGCVEISIQKTYEAINYSTFLIKSESKPIIYYYSEIYNDLTASKYYNYHSKNIFTFEDEKFNLNVVSENDIILILKYANEYAKNSNDQYVSIEFSSRLSVDSQLLNILTNAQINLGINLVHSFRRVETTNGNIVYIMILINDNL